jgi:E3 ubiquitin-protein ligase DMA1/2
MVLTQATPSSPGLATSGTATSTTSTSAAGATTASSGRSSRLRGLSYLRNYTQNHLLSRDSSGSSSNNNNNNNSQSARAISTQQRSPAESSTFPRSTDGPISIRRSKARTEGTHSVYEPGNGRDNNEAANSTTSLRRAVTTQGLTAAHSDTAESTLPSEADRAPTATARTEDPSADSTEMTRTRSATTGDASMEALPSIRFTAYYDSRSSRQSLTFTPVARTLPSGSDIIKVGRYSERENHAPVPANVPSAAPVGFKSKVVSRRHCEFWHEQGKWYIKDVKSSSGTFLNHIRLSPPGQESKPFPVNDGDIVQLGIDFRGGEEMIFRCVKMRIELNRGWQSKPNNFK